jgi:hypothetical protein
VEKYLREPKNRNPKEEGYGYIIWSVMMNNFKTITNHSVYLILVFLLISSCRSSVNYDKRKDVVRISLDGRGMGRVKIDSIDIIPIETSKDVLLSNNLKILFRKEGDFFVADFITQMVYRFNKNGKCLNSIGHKGRGAREYTSISDFMVHGDTVELLCGKGSNSEVLLYDKNGTFIKKKVIPLAALSFQKYRENYFFSTSYNKRYKYRIFVTDAKGNILQSFLPNTSNINIPVTEFNFFKYNNKLFYKEAFNYIVYQCKRKEIFPVYELDAGRYSIPPDFFNKKFITAFEEIHRRGYFLIKSFFETSEFSVFEILFQKMNEPSVIQDIVYNKNSLQQFE